MIVDRRRIDCLSLRAPAVPDVHRATRVIEAAFRTATLPGDGQPGRLFIRHLHLPPITLGRDKALVTRWIESRVRQLAAKAVPITDARAPKANAVVVRNEVGALTMALMLVGRGQRLTQWYWPRISPKLTTAVSPPLAAAAVWRILAARPDAPVVIPAVIAAIVDSPVTDAVLATVDEATGQVLRLATRTPLLPRAITTRVLAAHVPPRWRQIIAPWIRTWHVDGRAAWLVRMAVHAAHPRRAPVPLTELVADASDPAPRSARTAAPRRDTSAPVQPPHVATTAQRSRGQSDSPPARDRAAPVQMSPARPPSQAPATPVDAASVGLEPRAVQTRAITDTVAQPETARRETPRWQLDPKPEPTANGGLFFAVAVLRRLRLEAYLEHHPQLHESLGLCVMARLADRLELDIEDPIRRPLLEAADVEAPRDLPSRPVWDHEAGGRWTEPTDASPAPTFATLVDAWVDAVVAWFHRADDLDLEEVVRRDAAVVCTRTHVDVVFDMEASDIRIRRAALDLDPGWVPWLGRVVQFHYVYGGWWDG